MRASATFTWFKPTVRISQQFGLAAAALWLSACQSNSYQLNGTTDALADGQTVYLSADIETRAPIDSTVVVNGRFRFEGEIDSTRVATIYAQQDSTLSVNLLLVPGNADIMLSAPPRRAHISGSTVHNEWQAMNDQLAVLTDSLRLLLKHSRQLTDSGHIILLNEARRLEQQMHNCITATARRNSQNALGRFITSHYTNGLPSAR